jgi:cbb3-type cytochrome oxidase subunit 3
VADEEDRSDVGRETKKQTKQQRILIALGVLSIVVLWVLYRRGSASSANAAAAQQAALAQEQAQLAAQEAAYTNSYGYGAGSTLSANGYSMATDPYAEQMMALLQSLNGTLAGISATGTTGAQPQTSAPTPPSSASQTYYPPAAPEAGVGLFGSAQMQALQQQLAAGQISADEYQAVANAYEQAYQANPQQAQSEHFVAGPGLTITTIPAIPG